MRFAIVVNLLLLSLTSVFAQVMIDPQQQQPPPPPQPQMQQQKWLPFVSQQWNAAQALCQEEINPLAAQISTLQAQLAEARKQIEELKKPAQPPQ